MTGEETWRASYAEVLRAWEAVCTTTRGRADATTMAKVAVWRRRIQELGQTADALRRAGKWISGRPDLLGIIGRGRREVFHTAILAWLLDPTAPHGMGTEFVGRFLRLIGAESPGDLWSVRATKEEWVEEGRADVVLEGPGLLVVVEAKIDAGEGLDQCDRMRRSFLDRRDARFVYLTPDGRPPRTDSIGTFRVLTFRQVLACLREALASRPAALDAPGLPTIRTWIQTVEIELP